eukprot:4619292-Alexandrium_andersonii.AAC.1
MGSAVWNLYIARHPKCNPPSAQGPSVLQELRLNPQPALSKIQSAASVRSLNCADPGTASTL